MVNLTKFQAGVITVFATSQESWLTGSEVRHRIEGDPSISTVKRGLTRLVESGVLKVNKGNGASGGGYANRYSLIQDSPSTEREPENPGDYLKEESGQIRRPNSDAGLQDGVVKEKVVRDFTECPLYHASVKVEGEEPLLPWDEGIKIEGIPLPSSSEEPSKEETTKIVDALKGNGSVSGNSNGDDEGDDEDDENEENPREEEKDDEGFLMPWMEDKNPRAKEEVEAGMFGLFGGYSDDEDAKPKDGGGGFLRLLGGMLTVVCLGLGIKASLK